MKINCNFNQLYIKSSNFSFISKGRIKSALNFSSIEKSDYLQHIKEAMKRIAHYNVEHGMIFTKDGRLVREIIGNKDSFVTSNEDNKAFNKIIKEHSGCIVVHNHPDPDCLGQAPAITHADAYIGGCNNASEVIVVHSDGTYSSVKCLPDENQISRKSTDKIYDLFCTIAYNDTYREKYNNYGYVRDKLWREKAKELGIVYTNTYNYRR